MNTVSQALPALEENNSWTIPTKTLPMDHWKQEFFENKPNLTHEYSQMESTTQRPIQTRPWGSDFRFAPPISRIPTLSQDSKAWDEEFANVYQSLASESKITEISDEKAWENAFDEIKNVDEQEQFDDQWMKTFESAWKEAYPLGSSNYNYESDMNDTPKIMDPDPVTAPLIEYVFEVENQYLSHPDPFALGLSILEENGSLSEAALAFEAAVQRHPQDSIAWMHLGMTQAENEKEEPAIAALQRSVKEDHSNARALMVNLI